MYHIVMHRITCQMLSRITSVYLSLDTFFQTCSSLPASRKDETVFLGLPTSGGLNHLPVLQICVCLCSCYLCVLLLCLLGLCCRLFAYCLFRFCGSPASPATRGWRGWWPPQPPGGCTCERLAEYGWKSHRVFVVKKNLSRASMYCYMREQPRGMVSSNSRFQTVLFQQYSANLSD